MSERLCLCGCGQPISRNSYKWRFGCIPSSVRADAARASHKRQTLKRRAALFGGILKQLDDLPRRPTRGDLLAAMDVAYRAGYKACWNAQYRRRTGRLAA